MGARHFKHERTAGKEDADKRLDSYLLDFPYSKFDPSLSPSRTTIQKWIANGCVSVNGKIQTGKSAKIWVGDLVELDVEISSELDTPPPESLDIRIVYQDRHLVVLDKPPGITSHPVPNDLTGSVVNFLYHNKIPLPPTSHPLRPGIVHRLDRNTSGLMVVACTDPAAAALIEMIKRREMDRRYLAILFGRLPSASGTVDVPVGRNPRDRKKMAVTTEKQGKHARTHYRVLVRYPGFSLVGCRLDTGRTHQIRVHMSHLGFPVAGDPKYGGRKAADRINNVLLKLGKRDPDYVRMEITLKRVAEIITADSVHLLHAAKLSFPHPESGEMMSFTAEPHEKFRSVHGYLESIPHEEVTRGI